MDFPQTKKMRDLRTGDVFVRDDFTYVAIADPYYGTVWVTKPEFINEEGVYSYTSAALLQYEPEDEAEVIGQDERSLKMFRRKHTYLMKRSNLNATLLALTYYPVLCSVCHGRKEGMWEDQRRPQEPGSS